MVNPKNYLLLNIIGNEKNGLESLGRLHAEHVDDIAEVMRKFAEETLIEVIGRLNKGEKIKLSKGFIELKVKKIKK